MLKVCFVSHSSRRWGAERALIELMEALQKRGVGCYCILPWPGDLMKELRSRGIPFCVIPYAWWMGKGDSRRPPALKTLLNLAMPLFIFLKLFLGLLMSLFIALRIALWDCHIVYTNTITVCVGAIAARLLRRPHIWHIHEFALGDRGLVFDLNPDLSLGLMSRFSSFCIANSNAVAEQFRRTIPDEKLKVVYYAVRVPAPLFPEGEAISGRTHAGIRCAIVGRLQEGKRQEDAIRAVAHLVRHGIPARLDIVGDGHPAYQRYLEGVVRANSVDEAVSFLGYVENPHAMIRVADVVLVCSRREAFGRVTVEAMKAGKPVIGTRSGGTAELIREGVNGFLYTPGDDVQLAEKLRTLYEHPDVAQEMGQRGREWARNRFTERRYGEEVLAVLRQALHPK